MKKGSQNTADEACHQNNPAWQGQVWRGCSCNFSDQCKKLPVSKIYIPGNISFSGGAELQGVDGGLRYIPDINEIFAARRKKTKFLRVCRYDHLSGTEINVVGADHKSRANNHRRKAL